MMGLSQECFGPLYEIIKHRHGKPREDIYESRYEAWKKFRKDSCPLSMGSQEPDNFDIYTWDGEI